MFDDVGDDYEVDVTRLKLKQEARAGVKVRLLLCMACAILQSVCCHFAQGPVTSYQSGIQNAVHAWMPNWRALFSQAVSSAARCRRLSFSCAVCLHLSYARCATKMHFGNRANANAAVQGEYFDGKDSLHDLPAVAQHGVSQGNEAERRGAHAQSGPSTGAQGYPPTAYGCVLGLC